jgi:hypothetical protein
VDLLIKENKSIKNLNLNNNYLSNNAFRFIGENNTLKRLCIEDTNITDNVIDYILENNSLECLMINSRNITNEGLEKLSQHNSLKYIRFDGKNISIDGLLPFLHSKIQDLGIMNSKIHYKPLNEFLVMFNSKPKDKSYVETIQKKFSFGM